MLYALINGKLDLQSNKYIKEDSCTAAFFGPLLHLPDELIFKIIKEASSAAARTGTANFRCADRSLSLVWAGPTALFTGNH